MRCVCDERRQFGVVAVDVPLSDIDDVVRTITESGSRLHVFVVDRTDQTVLVHPHLKNSHQVSPRTFYRIAFIILASSSYDPSEIRQESVFCCHPEHGTGCQQNSS